MSHLALVSPQPNGDAKIQKLVTKAASSQDLKVKQAALKRALQDTKEVIKNMEDEKAKRFKRKDMAKKGTFRVYFEQPNIKGYHLDIEADQNTDLDAIKDQFCSTLTIKTANYKIEWVGRATGKVGHIDPWKLDLVVSIFYSVIVYQCVKGE